MEVRQIGENVGEIVGEPTVDNKLEILRFTSQVQSRIKKDISEDFVLAKLDAKDKEGIIEMTSNAYFVKKILDILSKKGRKWKWDNKEKVWVRRELNNSEKNLITEIANTTFDSYLNRIYMTVILSRNVANNHILKILAGVAEEKDEETEIASLKEKMSDLIKPEETK